MEWRKLIRGSGGGGILLGWGRETEQGDEDKRKEDETVFPDQGPFSEIIDKDKKDRHWKKQAYYISCKP